MTPEQIDAFRSWIYPFGFLSSLAFGLRFFVQWWDSERAGRSLVPKSFWILSCIGNALVAVHSLIQLHFLIYFLQSQQLVLSWRNLNLMGKTPWTLRRFLFLLIGTALAATILFAAQSAFLPPPSFGWIRSPRGYASAQEVGFWIHFIGCLGITAFSMRFWLQWWEAEQKGKSILSEHFWWISIIGTGISGIYFFLLSDWVNLIGPVCSIIPYSRNIVLLRREKKEHCDIAIIAGETSGDLLGEKIARALTSRSPASALCGVAGPAMRASGVRPWFRTESFQVMGIIDVLKKAPFLLFAAHRIVSRILSSKASAVICIDQPSFSIALAKQLKRRGYSGKLIQVVAPTVWAYKPERADRVAKYFDLILPLYRFEIDYFRDKLPAVWVGHPASALPLPDTATDSKKAIIALFPGSRPGEIRRNLPLQLKAAAMLIDRCPHLTVAISVTSTMKEAIIQSAKKFLDNRCSFVEFADRYRLMERSIGAIAKSGTVTLELALFGVPTVCCYQTGAFTRWWAKHVLKLTPRFFALPNILLGEEVVPERILPPVTPSDICHALHPYLQGKKSLPADLRDQLRLQIDSKGEVGVLIVQAVENLVKAGEE